MSRGKGVRLQKYKDGGISDAKLFNSAEGLTWTDSSGRNYSKSMEELLDWIGDRAQAGRQPRPASRATTGLSGRQRRGRDAT